MDDDASYTIFMILLTVLMGSALMGQLAPPEVGSHYKLFTKDGEELYVRCDKVQGDVWIFDIIGPDGTDSRVFPRSKVQDYEPVSEAAIQQHLDTIRMNRGEIKTPSGWVENGVYEFAQQARESALAQLKRYDAADDDAAIIAKLTENAADDNADRPGLVTLWGPQVGLAVGGLILIGIIVKLVILGGKPAAEG